MSRWNGKRGFDYFVDKYDSYLEDYSDDYNGNYYDESYCYESNQPRYQQPIDRFKKVNKYTGAPRGRAEFVDNTNHLYGIPTQSRQRLQGTVEFSALPGQGGLNPNQRPLGDQTMMVSNTSLANTSNPHLLKLLETQQLQLDQSQMHQNEIDRRMDSLDDQMNVLANKIDNVTRVINNTNTLTFKNDANTNTLDTNVRNQENTANISNSNTQEFSYSQPQSNTTSYTTPDPKTTTVNISVEAPVEKEKSTKIIEIEETIIDNNVETTKEITAKEGVKKAEKVVEEVKEEIKVDKKKKKNSTLVIFGFVVWALIIIAVIIVSILLFAGVIKF
ncbi:hypothetical protein ACJA29_03070 [Metamycoplasma sualvi]|uniref:hypothetical protein n=1 Tax=Metamycoplasma sualvi TaxID=2125 RepID=UPI003873898B